MTQQHSVAHPLAKRVPLHGGTLHVSVQPISMGVAREVRPVIVRILTDLIGSGDKLPATNDVEVMGVLIDRYESDVLSILQLVVPELPGGLTWETIDFEDFLNLAQAVWETSILRTDGGGLLGKALMLARAAVQMRGDPRLERSETRSPNGSAGSGPSQPTERSTPSSAESS